MEKAIQNALVKRRMTLPGLWDTVERSGFSHERMRWDLFWLANKIDKTLLKDCYAEGLKDSHIDTALRRITHAGDIEKDIEKDIKNDRKSN